MGSFCSSLLATKRRDDPQPCGVATSRTHILQERRFGLWGTQNPLAKRAKESAAGQRVCQKVLLGPLEHAAIADTAAKAMNRCMFRAPGGCSTWNWVSTPPMREKMIRAAIAS
jgi:hypothetical protein